MMQKSIGNCAHCPGGIGLEYPLYDDDLFWVVCDVHPIVRGHILMIPKEHIPAMGSLSAAAFQRYADIYQKIKFFINAVYGEAGIFEHGVTGQTVFHAHTHFLPFNHGTDEIISDNNALHKLSGFSDIRKEFAKKGKYLFFENNNQMWLVDTNVGSPRFFRDIFAGLLGAAERADWKKADGNNELIEQFNHDISVLRKDWHRYSKK
ncbi:MAG: HIT family protein [Patescibacteria group bacterium]|nr:HIT family protein [Patescibacteria group bacterium]